MSDLVAVGFNDTMKADEVLWRLRTLQSADLVDLEDAVVVIRDQSGKIQLKQSVDLAGAQASAGLIAGTFLGGLIGMLFLNPTAGFLLGGRRGGRPGPDPVEKGLGRPAGILEAHFRIGAQRLALLLLAMAVAQAPDPLLLADAE